MSQPTRTSGTKKKWPWVAGAVGGVVLIAGAVNAAGKSTDQAGAQTVTTVVTSSITKLVPTTVVSTSVVTSAVTSTVAAPPVTVTVTAPAAAAEAAVAEAPAAPAPQPLAAVPSTPQAPPTQEGQSGSLSGGVSYENCAEAEAAGAAPILRGEPGYAKELDRNNDGVACEDS